jgi:hypothetical protein
MTTPLSPATQAIIDASNCAGSRCVQLHIADALRAVVSKFKYDVADWQDAEEHVVLDARDILDVADELESQ